MVIVTVGYLTKDNKEIILLLPRKFRWLLSIRKTDEYVTFLKYL